MPKLSNVTLKAVALTGSPANRRPIHAKKSATEDFPMTPGDAENETFEALPAPSAEVLKALGEVKLTKAAGDADHEAAAEAVGRLLAANPGLTHEDLLAVAKAVGLEATAKSAAKKEDVDDEVDDETDEASDDGDEEEDAQGPKGKFKKGNPWAEKMKKSAEPSTAELDEVLKSVTSVEVKKAVEAMRKSYEERIAKNERIISEEREHRLTNLIKSEVESSFKHLAVDHGKLTAVLKHARESKNPTHAKDLLQVLKSAEAQVALAAKSGGTAFHSVGKSSQFGAGAGGDAMSQINAHVDSLVEKGEGVKPRAQRMDEFLMTDAGRALWAQHVEERGF